MSMPQAARVWTRDEVLALPDDGYRYELVDGELLVSPSPRWVHQRAAQELHALFRPFAKARRLGAVMLAPADLDFDGTQLLQPDLFIVRPRPDGRMPLDWREVGIPMLIAEVLSPSTARYDRITKRHRYLRSGVDQYWIVDADARLIERWTPSAVQPDIIEDRIEWRPERTSEPLIIDLPSYFAEVWDEI